MGYWGIRIAVAVSAISAGILALPADAADWKPVRPINLIVPWAAGGSTDQITRLVAGELEKSLGQTIGSALMVKTLSRTGKPDAPRSNDNDNFTATHDSVIT